MKIIVNGQPQELDDHATISQLLQRLNLHKAACAVEVNKALVPKARHQDRTLHEGDQVEVVSLVGGG
jgi:thiamine biosynthesis protein ThiS